MRPRALLRLAVTGAVAGVLLCGCNLGLSQSAILLDTDSTSVSNPTTSLAPFTTSGPWQISYTFDCTRANSQNAINSDELTIDVLNGDDNSTAAEHPQTTFVSVRSRGTLSFTRPGDYYLHIATVCDWTMQVIDLSGGAPASAAPAHVAQPSGSMNLDVVFSAVFGPYNCQLTGSQANLCSVGDGTAGSSPLGALTLHRTEALANASGGCASASTAAIITAANGDMLDLTSKSGSSCKGARGDTFHVTVTGGTGIFHGVTGSGTITDVGGSADHWRLTLTFPTGSSTT